MGYTLSQISAVQIKRTISANRSDDGQFVILKLANPDDSELILAIPPEEMRRLIDAGADSMEKCRKLAGEPKDPYGFHSDWYEVGRNVDNGDAVLTFTFGSGGKLTFHFGAAMATRLAESLNAAAGTYPDVPAVPKN